MVEKIWGQIKFRIAKPSTLEARLDCFTETACTLASGLFWLSNPQVDVNQRHNRLCFCIVHTVNGHKINVREAA